MPDVLLIHTGGTLGMQGAPLEPGDFEQTLAERVPELEDVADIRTVIPFNKDSSDVGPAEWAELINIIERERLSVDGFVIVHGTDTMAYTASALAMALSGLDRPVILTGAQRPLAQPRTDARRNLVDSVALATEDIPEVGICFDGLMLRGCRTTKTNVRDYRGFGSPGCEPLATLGVDMEFNDHIRRPSMPFRAEPEFDPRVVVQWVSPGMHAASFDAVLEADEPPGGIVLAAYGVGTVPVEDSPVAPLVDKAVDRGIDVLVVTQSSGRIELDLYANSRVLQEAGAIPGGGMTVEAATAKLMHARGLHDDAEARRDYLETDVAGELG